MKLSEQVCTLEQAKKLKELGVDARTIFNWVRYDHYPATIIPVNYYYENAPDYEPYDYMGTIHEEYPAYTVAELGIMLPSLGISFVKSNDGNGNDFWWIETTDAYRNIKGLDMKSYSEAELRGNLLIYLLESNLITHEQVNKRLK